MAVNDSRSMTGDFNAGVTDASYIHLVPDRVNVENPPVDRLTWPRYQNAGRWVNQPFYEAHLRNLGRPAERTAWYGRDLRT